MTLAAYDTATVAVLVDIPANVLGGETDSVMVTAVSQGDAAQTASHMLTTRANYRLFVPIMTRP